jgi:hypothetical protein
MEWQWLNGPVKFLKVLWSYFVALARLVVWTAILFFSGLQRTLFMRSEVVGVDFRVVPLRCYMEETDEKLAYLDKLCIENPDLLGIEMEDEDIPFDDLIDDEEIDFRDDDEDNGEDK